MNESETPDEPPEPSFAPWDDPDYPWDERPLPPPERQLPPAMNISKNDNNPTVVELVFALKKWEVVAHDGKETFKIIANIEMYWTDDRMIGFPTLHKPMPENIWRPRLNGCAGFDLGKAENYEQLPRFYGYDSTQEHKPSDGRMAQTFPVNLKDGFDISADMERFKSFPLRAQRHPAHVHHRFLRIRGIRARTQRFSQQGGVVRRAVPFNLRGPVDHGWSHPAVAVQDGDGLRLRERLLGADADPGGRLRGVPRRQAEAELFSDGGGRHRVHVRRRSRGPGRSDMGFDCARVRVVLRGRVPDDLRGVTVAEAERALAAVGQGELPAEQVAADGGGVPPQDGRGVLQAMGEEIPRTGAASERRGGLVSVRIHKREFGKPVTNLWSEPRP